MDISTLKERRRTIFDLDSYSASGPSTSDLLRLASVDYVPEPPKEIRYSVSLVIQINVILFLYIVLLVLPPKKLLNYVLIRSLVFSRSNKQPIK